MEGDKTFWGYVTAHLY